LKVLKLKLKEKCWNFHLKGNCISTDDFKGDMRYLTEIFFICTSLRVVRKIHFGNVLFTV